MVRSEGNISLKSPVTPPGIDPGTVRLVAQRLNHYDNPGPSEYVILSLFHYNNGCTSPSQCYVKGTLPVLLTSICGAQEVKPSGSPFLCYQDVPGFNLRFHRYSEITPGLSSDRPGKGRSYTSKYFTNVCFLHTSTPTSVHRRGRLPRCIIDLKCIKGHHRSNNPLPWAVS
jgi:hypothetical protein